MLLLYISFNVREKDKTLGERVGRESAEAEVLKSDAARHLLPQFLTRCNEHVTLQCN